MQSMKRACSQEKAEYGGGQLAMHPVTRLAVFFGTFPLFRILRINQSKIFLTLKGKILFVGNARHDPHLRTMKTMGGRVHWCWVN